MSGEKALDVRSRILFIYPNGEGVYGRLSSVLEKFEIIKENNPSKATEFFLHNDVDLVLLGHTKYSPCLALLDFFKSAKPSIPVIIMTDCGSERLAVTVFRHGARDYFRKPFIVKELKKSIESALKMRENQEFKNSNSICRALRYINENYTKPLRLSQVAMEAGMSLSNFERTFKREMGITFSRFVNKLRISKATKMLKGNSLSMSEIAFDSGFTNQYHFTRMFKKIMNIPPIVYRKSL
ncbi:MAG: helix-turn-helix domain-containing protein [Deltaproteobacteria bacterium]|nr:helix-turn-helix domain-containing protein [Deltaproteobacteria bacterium]